jgi:uncharacterized surface protein with fasciclin (FAS1) repeats
LSPPSRRRPPSRRPPSCPPPRRPRRHPRRFNTLVTLVNKAGLAGALSDKTKLTVFAPTDAAFAKVPKQTLNALAQDRAKLRKVLLYHVVPGAITARQVVKLRSAKTLEGARVRFRVRNGKVFVNRAQVVKTDVLASNGVIHVINRVLIPSQVASR